MKKLILGALTLLGTCSIADANILTINNQTNCTYDLSIGGIGTSNPSVALPGTSTFTSSPITTISGVKIMFVNITGAISQINVDNGSPFANSTMFPAPACPVPFNYITALWQTAPNGDVTLTIL